MPKIAKLVVCAFVAVDVFIVSYLGLSQLRLQLFGQGQIPGGGSALDMALFLLPLFGGYVAGDRLYYFLTYKNRRAARPGPTAPPHQKGQPAIEKAGASLPARPQPSVWEDRGWDEPEQGGKP